MASLKTFFGKLLGFMSSEEPDPAELESLKAELANLPDVPDEPEPEDEKDPPADKSVAALEKQVGELKAAFDQEHKAREKAEMEHAAALAEEKGKRQHAELSAKVDGMVSEGHLAPANRDKLVAVLEALPAETKATFAAADGKTEEKALGEAVLDLVKANGLKALFGERGQALLESADPDKVGSGAGLSDERIDQLVKRTGMSVAEGGK